MKYILIIFMAVLLLPSFVHGQGSLYVSNLGQTPVGSAAIASDSWVAERIVTGTDSGGYALNSVQLRRRPGSGSPSGFGVSIYSFNSVNYQPGSDLGDLAGSDPLAGGVYSYAASGITLSPSTIYYVVLTAATPMAQGAYEWSSAGVALGNNQWQINDVSLSSPNGSSWTFNPRGETFQLGIYAMPVQEPSVCALGIVGALVGGFSCRRTFRR